MPFKFKKSCPLILVAAALYLIGNARVALWDRDEPRYAMASRYMLQTGDWVVPRMGWGLHPETPRTAKPPLVYWCQAAAMKVLGPTVFAARFPSSLAMILTLIVLAITLRKYFPRHASWTLLILATSVLTIICAKMCAIDSIQLLFIVICELCVYAIWQRHFCARTIIFFGLALGLASLAKGPVAWGVLVTTLIILYILRRTLPKTGGGTSMPLKTNISPFIAVALIAIIIPIPWLILVHHRDPSFLSRIIGHDLLQRMHEPLEGHKGPPGFYLLTIFATFYPWSLFLPLIIIHAWRNRTRTEIRFALAAVIGPWLMFECISTKMVHYVLPVFPPLAFLLADAIACALKEMQNNDRTSQNETTGSGTSVPLNKTPYPDTPARAEQSRTGEAGAENHSAIGNLHSAFSSFPRWAIAIWAIITTAIATALILPDRWFPQVPLWPAIIMVIAGLIYAITVLTCFWKKKIRSALLTMGLGFALFIILLFTCYLPTAAFLRISPNVAAILNQNHITNARMFGYEEESLAFYDQGRIDSLNGTTLHTPLSAWPDCLVITSDLFQKLPPSIQSYYHPLGSTRGINYSKSIKPIEVIVLKKIP